MNRVMSKEILVPLAGKPTRTSIDPSPSISKAFSATDADPDVSKT
jgi:hypothetical protein